MGPRLFDRRNLRRRELQRVAGGIGHLTRQFPGLGLCQYRQQQTGHKQWNKLSHFAVSFEWLMMFKIGSDR